MTEEIVKPVILRLPDAQATYALGKQLGTILAAGSVILLAGDLGAGKTTLVQGIGAGLGIADAIDSPTFTLINEYTEGRLPLYHLDLYRLQPEEIKTLHLDIYWEGKEVAPGITAIEWGQRLPYQPPNYLEIQLIHTEGEGRQVQMQWVGVKPFVTSYMKKFASNALLEL